MNAPTVNHDQLMILLLLSDDEIRGFEISEKVSAFTGARFTLGWMIYHMHSLKGMGYVKSRLDGASTERGGNRDQFYSVTDKWKKQRDAIMGESSVAGKR